MHYAVIRAQCIDCIIAKINDRNWNWNWNWRSGIGIGIGIVSSGIGIGIGIVKSENAGIGIGIGIAESELTPALIRSDLPKVINETDKDIMDKIATHLYHCFAFYFKGVTIGKYKQNCQIQNCQ